MTSRTRPHRQGDSIQTPARDANRVRDILEKSLNRMNSGSPHSVDDGIGGTTAPDYPRFALFQIPEQGIWEPGPSSDGEQPDKWAFMADCQYIWYSSADRTYQPTEDPPPETIWHVNAYPSDHGEDLRTLHEATDRFPAKYGPLDFVWCYFNPQAGRWEVFDTYEDHWRFEVIQTIPQGGCGIVYLRLAQMGQVSLSGSGPVSDQQQCTNIWDTTTFYFTVYDSLELGPFEPGAYGLAKRFGDSDRWEILFAQQDAGDSLVKAVVTSTDQCPGIVPPLSNRCDCDIYVFDTTACDYEFFASGTLHDRCNQNCVLAGESVMGTLRRCNGEYHVDIIGSHGTMRFAKVTSARIDCDSTGSAAIYASIGSQGSSGVGSSSGGVAKCGGEVTGCTIPICNAMGYTRVLKLNEEVPVKYMGYTWTVITTPYPTTAHGTLTTRMCPDEQGGNSSSLSSASVEGFTTDDYCGYDPGASSSGLADTLDQFGNPDNLCGEVGDRVEFKWSRGEDRWNVVQVTHKFRTPITDTRTVMNGDQQCLEVAFQTICVPTCDDDKEWEELICAAPCEPGSSSGGGGSSGISSSQ
jgi:hypothetical protein